MSISSAGMAKSASGYLAHRIQYFKWSMAEKNRLSDEVYSVRIDLPQFLLFPPPPQNMCRISILAFGLTLNTNFLVFHLQNALQMANESLSSLFML